MTRRDYELVAEILKDNRDVYTRKNWLILIQSFAWHLSKTNKAFNKDLFYVKAGCSMEDMDEIKDIEKIKEEWYAQ